MINARERIATRKLCGLYGRAGAELLRGYLYPAWRLQTLGYSLERFIEFWFAADTRPIYYARGRNRAFLRGRLIRVCWQANHDELRTRWYETVSCHRERTKQRFGLPDSRWMEKGDLIQVRRDTRTAIFEVELYKTGKNGFPVIYTFEMNQEQFNRIRPKVVPTRGRRALNIHRY